VLPVATDDVLEFLAQRRTPRARATKKLEDVLARLVAGEPPLDRLRTAWVLGSYARGALDVGDVDLFVMIDEARSRSQQSLDAYYRRAHPYAEIVKALGCGAGSIVSLDVEPVFEEEHGPADNRPVRNPPTPVLGHLVTGEPFDPPPRLLWARGDTIETARSRLAAIPEDPKARRFERTTTVPLLDELQPLLGVETAFVLAVQVRRENVELRAVLLESADAPSSTRGLLGERYSEGSARRGAAASALAYLECEGVDLETVRLVDAPATGWRQDMPEQQDEEVVTVVDFNAFRLYSLGAGAYPTGWRHLHVWPRTKRGPWLALQARVLDRERASNVHHAIHRLEGGPEARAARVRRILYGA
jgi:hypothetical protein